MPSKELEYVVLYLIKKHKHEILKDRDWWYGIPKYTINVHDYNENDIHFTRLARMAWTITRTQ